MNQAIYARLKQAARNAEPLSYSDIAPLAGLDMSRPDHRNLIAKILDEISTHEHELGRPLLSALVIRGGDTVPGLGFFTLARRLGAQAPREDNIAFFARELSRVYDTWRGLPADA